MLQAMPLAHDRSCAASDPLGGDMEHEVHVGQHWTFFGRLLPERLPLKIELPGAVVDIPDFGLAFEMYCGIADAQFVADVTTTKGTVDIHTLRNVVEQQIRATTDLIGYINGFGYDIETISTICRETGERCIFGFVIPLLSQRRGGVFVQSLDPAIYSAVLGEVGARIVLANFREAIKVPVDSGFFCYRALDAMMQSVKLNENEKEQKAWGRLWAALNVERSVTNVIKKLADAQRHGRQTTTTDDERGAVFRTTDEIIKRYLAYLARGRSQLSEAEFPRFVE
jgi:hypothetical protein